MKLTVDLPTLLAAIVALRVRAVEARAAGLQDCKWLRAHRQLEQAVRESLGADADKAICDLRFH